MPKFRKTALIEASQFNKFGDHPAVQKAPESPTGFGLYTLENTKMRFEVTPGDWIVTNPGGEHYAIKPDVFSETYEPVQETPE